MGREVYEARGTIENGVTIVLDAPLPVRGRVRVHIEPEDRAAQREERSKPSINANKPADINPCPQKR